jgi:tetratricopeptide (TPR) repeat protein
MPPVSDTPSFEKQVQVPDAAGAAGIVMPPSPVPQSSPGGLGGDAATRTNHIAELFLSNGQAVAEQGQPTVSGELPALQRIRETAGAALAPDRAALLMERLRSTADEIDAAADADVNEPQTSLPKPSGQLVGDQVHGQYETLTKSQQERFDRYLKVAESYLRQGQYSRAAESFSLASVYSPNDRRVHIGRCHALFAAGEYVNSAVFLAKAIELDPNQTLARTDLVNETGGPELFLRRITDLEERAKPTGTPDMQLLLAYVYYEMGRPQEARTAIEAAEKGLPRLPAVELLKAVIGW